jgi:hypothetical protein
MTSGRSEEAERRRRNALSRVEELRELRRRLEQGEPPTQADVDLAELRAEQSKDAGERALERAAEAHQRAALAHRSAATAADRAGEQTVAAQHREAADADDRAARG